MKKATITAILTEEDLREGPNHKPEGIPQIAKQKVVVITLGNVELSETENKFIEYINATNAKTFSFQIFTLLYIQRYTFPVKELIEKNIFNLFFLNILRGYHVTV